MRWGDQIIGGLNLFGTETPALAEGEQKVARSLADVATLGILQQRTVHRVSLLAEQLQNALNTRIVIEQAKGFLAEHGQIEMQDAFEALRAFARSTGAKIGDVAHDVVHRSLAAESVLARTRS